MLESKGLLPPTDAYELLRCEAVPAILQTISDKKPCLRKVVFRGHGFFVNNGMESSEEFTLKSQNRKTGQRNTPGRLP